MNITLKCDDTIIVLFKKCLLICPHIFLISWFMIFVCVCGYVPYNFLSGIYPLYLVHNLDNIYTKDFGDKNNRNQSKKKKKERERTNLNLDSSNHVFILSSFLENSPRIHWDSFLAPQLFSLSTTHEIMLSSSYSFSYWKVSSRSHHGASVGNLSYHSMQFSSFILSFCFMQIKL